MTGKDGPGGAAIVGLGITDIGKVYGRSVTDFALDAVQRALADCGLAPSDVDGLITSYGMSGAFGNVPAALGLRNLGLNVNMFAAGATASAAIQYAAMAVTTGMARNVVYVHADAPLQDPSLPSGSSYATGERLTGIRTVAQAVGLTSPNSLYALAARRHMSTFGTTSEQLGAIAVAQRTWATGNPIARFRAPMTLDDHQSSRMIADPLHLLDCCMVSNGAIAFVLTADDRAEDMPQPPVHVLGWGQGHPTYSMTRGCEFGLVSGAGQSGETALRMAGVTLDEIDQAQLYDCYTFTVLLTLEDYGFCAKGEGGPFVASGALDPGGSLPVNTGGGQLERVLPLGGNPALRGGRAGSRARRRQAGGAERPDSREWERGDSRPPRDADTFPPSKGVKVPIAKRDHASSPYFDALGAGQLSVLRCERCATWIPPGGAYADPPLRCPACGSGSLRWTPTQGTGRLITWTTDPLFPGIDDGAPGQTAALVELTEGPWVIAALAVLPDELREGLDVVFESVVPAAGGEAVPVFRRRARP